MGEHFVSGVVVVVFTIETAPASAQYCTFYPIPVQLTRASVSLGTYMFLFDVVTTLPDAFNDPQHQGTLFSERVWLFEIWNHRKQSRLQTQSAMDRVLVRFACPPPKLFSCLLEAFAVVRIT